MNKDKIKEISIGVLAVFMYFFLNSIQYVPFQLAGVTTDLLPTWVKIFYLIIYEIMTIAIMLLIFNKKITKDFKDMLINHKEYYSKYFKYYLIGLGIMLISNSIIVYVFDGGISTNEETIRDIFKISPLYIYFSSVIYAPIVEELTFRQGIRNIFGRNILFVLMLLQV
jgi:membrane protease YdiL (CAAX protease family)